MGLLEDFRNGWNNLDVWDKLLIAAAIVILAGEALGWWNDAGLLALNTVILGSVIRLRESVSRLDTRLAQIERNTRD